MDQPTFRPLSTASDTDALAGKLATLARYILIVSCGLSAILFVPLVYLPAVFTKVLIIIIAVGLAMVFFALTILRQGSLTMRFPMPLLAFGLIIIVSTASALFSGDMRDALIGGFFDPHTVAFTLFLGVIIISMNMLQNQKRAVMQLYGLIIFSAVVLAFFHVLRLVFGADFLSLGVFTASTASPLGGWNDLALYFGLTVLLCILAISQLPMTRVGRAVLWFVSLSALVMLGVINFFLVWVVLGLVSASILVYTVTQKQSNQLTIEGEENVAFGTLLLTGIVTVVSIVFIFGGPGLARVVSEYSNIQYTEVRPSYSATFDIASQVLDERPFLGAGPNKFVDAWRQYKDVSINQTVFWNTPFRSGISFITTAVVETGIIGALTWLLFFASLLYMGFRVLAVSTGDRFWRFVALSSLIATVYLWGMTVIYVPNQTTLILAAVCTGVFLATATTMVPVRSFSISLTNNRSLGFAMVGLVLVVIIAVVSSLYFSIRLTTNVYSFNQAVGTIEPGDSLESLTNHIVSLYQEFENDVYARQIAQYELGQLRALMGLTEPNEEQQALFERSVVRGVNAGQTAVDADPSEMANWQVLGSIYLTISQAGVEGATERAREAFVRARELSPSNPVNLLRLAEVSVLEGDLGAAREFAEEAVRLRPRYTEAIFFITQIDVEEGRLGEAIAGTRGIISLEPTNPVRYYQLGILEGANGNQQAAVTAFERAIELDSDYANARYYLAVQYYNQGRTEEAVQQLEIIRNLNSQNASVSNLIDAIQNGTLPGPTEPGAETVEALEGEESPSEDNVRAEDLDTDLVTPVNTVPESGATEGDRPEASTEEDADAEAVESNQEAL